MRVCRGTFLQELSGVLGDETVISGGVGWLAGINWFERVRPAPPHPQRARQREQGGVVDIYWTHTPVRTCYYPNPDSTAGPRSVAGVGRSTTSAIPSRSTQ